MFAFRLVCASLVLISCGWASAFGCQDDGLVPISPREEQGRRDVLIGFRSADQDEKLEQEEELPTPKGFDETTLREKSESDPTGDVKYPSLVGEAIRQRYPDGKVQILRYVRQDDAGNFFNNGPWKLFNRDGQIMAEGQFQNGMMHGTWSRWHPTNSEGIFRTQPFSAIPGPYQSVVSFNHGKLDGVWTIFDRSRRKLFEMQYVDGLRDGSATWWNNSGSIVREMRFQQGLLHGDAIEYDDLQKPIKTTTHIRGRRVYAEVTMHRENEKKSEDYFLDAKLELNGDDNWWDAKPAEYVRNGEPVRHGATRAWYENGQPRMEGVYAEGARHGRFIWWHPNGQPQLIGEILNDKKVGEWTWWHANGMKAVDGIYVDGEPTGKWSWWDENGKITRSGEIGVNQINTRQPADTDDDTPILSPPDVEGFEEIDPADDKSGGS